MSTRFKFADDQGVLTALEVHEPEASAERLYHVLLSMRIQLVHVAESVSEGKTVVRLSVCELDGARIKPPRRQAIVEELSVLLAGSNVAEAGSPAKERKPRRAA
jgi:hypothetical protein